MKNTYRLASLSVALQQLYVPFALPSANRKRWTVTRFKSERLFIQKKKSTAFSRTSLLWWTLTDLTANASLCRQRQRFYVPFASQKMDYYAVQVLFANSK